MANYRLPGPITGGLWPGALQDGTLALTLMPPPGPICSEAEPYAEALAKKPESRADPDLSYLFTSCFNPEMGLRDEDYQEAATSLNVEIAAIKAVAEVETSGKAFDENGRPRILYERHYFHRLTDGKYSKKHPDISNATSGGYGKFSSQYPKLERAYELDRDAVLRSASWGRFQIMGNNFQAAGFTSVAWFVLAMTQSESAHLKAFTSFVQSNKSMHTNLRDKDWAAFAASYNGPNYKDNQYDTKMEAAYKRLTDKPASAREKP